MNASIDTHRRVQFGPFTYSDSTIINRRQRYMRRWVLEGPWGALRLHHIMLPDPDRDLHDHPFDFWSLILWGWYAERVIGLPAPRIYSPLSINAKIAEHPHRISACSPHGVWTLVWAGPRRRKWGFVAREGWVPWDEYERTRPTP